MVKVSVIIPTFNGAFKVLKALQALEQQTIKPYEVIVVVDGSTDETVSMLQENTFDLPSLIIHEQANGGRSVSRNAGARLAKGDLLIFFDDDMRPVKTCLAEHISHHDQNRDSILVGSQIEDFQAVQTDIQYYKGELSRKWEAPLANNGGKITRENLFLTAANFSLSKSLFWELGGFDERLTDAEDFDLGVRAILNKKPIFFNPKAIGWHDDFISCSAYIERQIQYRKAHAKLMVLKPDLYRTFNNHQVKEISGLKKGIYYLFSFKLWPYLIDNANFLLIFPKAARYKIYNFVITAQSLYFPAS